MDTVILAHSVVPPEVDVDGGNVIIGPLFNPALGIITPFFCNSRHIAQLHQQQLHLLLLRLLRILRRQEAPQALALSLPRKQ